ncbi:heat shock protein 70 kDa, partial [Trifolium pratense]
VDDVVLVGGSSRIPKVQQLLEDFFNGKDLCKSINPDEAVAFGAAVQAALLSGGVKNFPKLVLVDVTPLSLGYEKTQDRMTVVIPRNTPIPVKNSSGCKTVMDNQYSSLINVYEGERTRASHNNLLGYFRLCGIPPAPRGHPICVSFSIDENGVLTVSAKEVSTGIMNEVLITNYSERLSTEEIKKLIKEAEKYRDEDKKFLQMAEVRNELDDCIYKIETALKKQNVKLKICTQESKNIDAAIRRAKNLLDENHEQEIDVLENHLKELNSPIPISKNLCPETVVLFATQQDLSATSKSSDVETKMKTPTKRHGDDSSPDDVKLSSNKVMRSIKIEKIEKQRLEM